MSDTVTLRQEQTWGDMMDETEIGMFKLYFHIDSTKRHGHTFGTPQVSRCLAAVCALVCALLELVLCPRVVIVYRN